MQNDGSFNPEARYDAILVGAGIMSATLAALLHKLDPQLRLSFHRNYLPLNLLLRLRLFFVASDMMEVFCPNHDHDLLLIDRVQHNPLVRNSFLAHRMEL